MGYTTANGDSDDLLDDIIADTGWDVLSDVTTGDNRELWLEVPTTSTTFPYALGFYRYSDGGSIESIRFNAASAPTIALPWAAPSEVPFAERLGGITDAEHPRILLTGAAFDYKFHWDADHIKIHVNSGGYHQFAYLGMLRPLGPSAENDDRYPYPLYLGGTHYEDVIYNQALTDANYSWFLSPFLEGANVSGNSSGYLYCLGDWIPSQNRRRSGTYVTGTTSYHWFHPYAYVDMDGDATEDEITNFGSTLAGAPLVVPISVIAHTGANNEVVVGTLRDTYFVACESATGAGPVAGDTVAVSAVTHNVVQNLTRASRYDVAIYKGA